MKDNMHCRYCGGSVALTDKICPHCGRDNPIGQQYQKDTDKYQAKTDTADQYISEQKLNTVKFLVRGIIMAVLVVTFISGVVYLLRHDSYFEIQSGAAKREDEVKANLDRYWEDEDYYSFFNYAESINIAGWADGPFVEYHPQIEAAQLYIFINNYVTEYLAADNTYDKNRALSGVCSLLDEFYDMNNLHYIYGKLAMGADSDEKVQSIYDNMGDILKTYFYINDDEALAVRSMSSNQIQLVIEESIERHDALGD